MRIYFEFNSLHNLVFKSQWSGFVFKVTILNSLMQIDTFNWICWNKLLFNKLNNVTFKWARLSRWCGNVILLNCLYLCLHFYGTLLQFEVAMSQHHCLLHSWNIIHTDSIQAINSLSMNHRSSWILNSEHRIHDIKTLSCQFYPN